MSIKIGRHFRICLFLLPLLAAFVSPANAQFTSGSTGADGALDYSNMPSGSTVVFDPGKFDITTHPLGQNVYNFTTITIPANVTVVLSGQLMKSPVFWLATGDVRIDGTILANGQNGPDATVNTSLRVPAQPGPGGFFGGIGGDQTFSAQPGDGPLGGGAGGVGNGVHGFGGGFSGNVLFAPPVGGSGGGGGFCPSPTTFGPGGGGGGGALVIASSTQIILDGVINARGGGAFGGCDFGGGAGGGAVKLVANGITGNGNGSIVANGGASNVFGGAAGAIRLEAFSFGARINTDIPTAQAAPGALFVPNQPVSIQVVSVAGVQLPVRPSGSFATPDVTINSGSPVPVTIQTAGIPPGTILTLNIYSEDGSTQTVQTTALQGTLQSATATANVTFPPDLSLGYLKATWTTP